MPRVSISSAAHSMLVAHALDTDTVMTDVRELPDGRFEIEVDDDVLAGFKLVDPDLDTAILKACQNLLNGNKRT